MRIDKASRSPDREQPWQLSTPALTERKVALTFLSAGLINVIGIGLIWLMMK